jgi:hypothetical protein
VLWALGFLIWELLVFLKSQKPGWYKRGGMSYANWRMAVGGYYIWHVTVILAAALTVISYFSTSYEDVLFLTVMAKFLFATKMGKGITVASAVITLSGLAD